MVYLKIEVRHLNLKILMLVDSLNVGGTETHVLSLAKQLTTMGAKVLIGTSGGPFLDTFEKSGLEVIYLPFRTDDPVGEEYQVLLEKTKKFVETRNIDLFHAHSIAGLKVAVQVGQELLIPTVATIHGKFYPPRKLRGLLDRCSQTIAVSEPVVTWLKEKVLLTPKQITLIPNGIETEHFKPSPTLGKIREELNLKSADKLAVVVSRLAWEKTRIVEAAIQATVHLQKEFPLRLAIVGTGAHTPLIHAAALLANNTVNKEIVNVLGWRVNTLECYEGADLVIGTARVALEALSSGKPVVAGGNTSYFGYLEPENLDHAWNAYFGDHQWVRPLTLEALKKDLRFVLQNPNLFESYAPTMRDWVVAHFEISTITKKTLELYQSVITGIPLEEPPKTTPPVIVHKPVPPLLHLPKTDPELTAQRPLISVAIPAYNRATYLRECLDSVVAQSYRPLEIIVVNDGSSDKTEEVALAWWNSLVNTHGLSFIYLKLPHNTGYSSAQSIAYQISSGDYIANQDSDDISLPKRLESQLFFLQANPDYSFVGCNLASFQDDPTQTNRTYMLRYGYETISNTYRDGGHCVSFGTLLFKRQIFERIGGLTKFLKGAEDYEWIVRALNQGYYVDNLTEELYLYREHPDQLSKSVKEVRRKLQQFRKEEK